MKKIIGFMMLISTFFTDHFYTEKMTNNNYFCQQHIETSKC